MTHSTVNTYWIYLLLTTFYLCILKDLLNRILLLRDKYAFICMHTNGRCQSNYTAVHKEMLLNQLNIPITNACCRVISWSGSPNTSQNSANWHKTWESVQITVYQITILYTTSGWRQSYEVNGLSQKFSLEEHLNCQTFIDPETMKYILLVDISNKLNNYLMTEQNGFFFTHTG